MDNRNYPLDTLNEIGGVTLPHLLTMGDGCPFRPLRSLNVVAAYAMNM